MARLVLVVVAMLVGMALSAAPAMAQADERVIYASVVDNRGQPVVGLTSRDFIVREDGQAREVLRVSKDEDPLQIALLIDNSVVMRNRIGQLRRGVSAFIKALRPGVQLSLVTLAERPTTLVPYTTDSAALQAGVGRLIPHDAANYVLDGIAETSEALASRRGARSVVAVVTGRGPEYSHREYPEVLRIVRDNGTPALHVLMVGGIDANQAIEQAQRDPRISDVLAGGPERDILLGRLTKETGGRYEDVLSLQAISMKMQQLAGELSNQYKVVYARPQRLVPPKHTEISARDPKLKARGMVVAEKD